MRVTIVVDGNTDHSDWAMVQVAKEVFCEEGITCFNLTHLPNGAVGEGKGEGDGNGDEEWQLGPLVPRRALLDANVVCITQPHAGKRNAMYTAFCVAQARGAAYVLNTDSDTVLDASCLSHMVATMEARPHRTAAVAGVLRIFGPFNWLVKMTAARYRIAFQVERAAQGYWGSVLCVSGPLGLYNLKVVTRVKDEWVNQVGWETDATSDGCWDISPTNVLNFSCSLLTPHAGLRDPLIKLLYRIQCGRHFWARHVRLAMIGL
jgi:cellulose synthase/poly-beta-1,6-N-acetylglucosamine synthase-like glycosyltransferase